VKLSAPHALSSFLCGTNPYRFRQSRSRGFSDELPERGSRSLHRRAHLQLSRSRVVVRFLRAGLVTSVQVPLLVAIVGVPVVVAGGLLENSLGVLPRYRLLREETKRRVQLLAHLFCYVNEDVLNLLGLP